MEPAFLQCWKAKIADYQQQVRCCPPVAQGTLFEVPRSAVDPDAIEPFYLQPYNFFFFEKPADQHPGKPAIYFVIDATMSLILYIGETVKANQRWKGIHDCKRYVLNYRQLHFQYGLETAINTAFYWDTPAALRSRLQLESALIYKWRSPFNKENWEFWGTPFVSKSELG
jgi:hypothetical protein